MSESPPDLAKIAAELRRLEEAAKAQGWAFVAYIIQMARIEAEREAGRPGG